MADYGLSYDFIIPVLNEEERLPVGLPILYQYLVDVGLKSFTVTVADNGSTDATESVARQLMSDYPNMRYIKVGKRGVGLALKTAWGQSTADIVGYLDVDLATDIKHILEVLSLFKEDHVAIVNGSRNMPSSCVRNRSLVRTITSLGFNMLLRLALGVKFTDGMCGFKFLRRCIYEQIMTSGLVNDGWFFCTEMLFVAEKIGIPIHELAVRWTDDRNTRVRLFGLTMYYVNEIFKLRRRRFVSQL